MEGRAYLSFEDFFKSQLPFRRGTVLSYLDGNEQIDLTLNELYDEITAKQRHFSRLGINSIAILKELGIDMVSSLIGASMAGLRTTLISPLMPVESISKMLVASQSEGIDINEEEFEDSEIRLLYKSLHKSEKSVKNGDGNFIFFTSGTTSLSKPVEISSRAFLAASYNGQAMLPCRENDTVISFLPLEHVFGFVCSFLWPLVYGGKVAIGRGIKGIVEDINIFKPTIIPVIPSLAKFMVLRNLFNKECRVVLVGAGPLDDLTIKALRNKDISLAFGYGLTETASGVAISVSSDNPYAMDFCPNCDFRIEPEGTISIKTDSLMEGYFNQEEETKKVVSDGWFKTNDLGLFDIDHRLHIIGRKDDILVLANGTKFNCVEAEEIISRIIPDVDFAIFNDHGQTALIFHHYLPDALNTVKNAINIFNRLQPISRRIYAIKQAYEKLPRTKTGKIQRFMLDKLKTI